MSIPLRKSYAQVKDRQLNSTGGTREVRKYQRQNTYANYDQQKQLSTTTDGLNQGGRDKCLKATPGPGGHETYGSKKQSAGRGSLFLHKRDVESKVLALEALDGDLKTTIDESMMIIKADGGRKTTVKPTSLVGATPIGPTRYPRGVSTEAPTAVKNSATSIPKATGPPRALGRSQSVRRADAVETGGRHISQGYRPRASVTTIPHASALAAPAPHRRTPSLTQPAIQSSLRSVLGQASAAANQHGRSVTNLSGSGAYAKQAIGCGSLRPARDVEQKPAITSTLRASRASSGSVPPKSLYLLKNEDSPSKPRTRISSAPTGQPAKLRRPEFSTLQQHFTPKKGSKPTTTSLLRSSHKQSGADVLSPEIIILQTELLQMHVLHRSACTVQSQWERSAKLVFRQQFEKLIEHDAGISTKEHNAQEHLNLLALTVWCQDDLNLQLAEKALFLSQTIQDVQTMTDPGGKFNRVVAVFEKWFEWSSRLLQSREERQMVTSEELVFIEDLGDGWKAELAALERKLASTAREFGRLGPAREGSSLAFVLTSLRKMITAMQDEIASIRIIETQILTQEQAWVTGLLADLTSDINCDLISSEASLRKGVWQEVG
ncbi:MAG: hypothetical protein LQ347_003674 [Umbilicaria vellea]|nr:MAG: hypothetical protein LQ347_003674 [Umbilicaria vellea]